MSLTRREFVAACTAALVGTTLAACSQEQAATDEPAGETVETPATPEVDLTEFKDLELSQKAWHYDAEHDAWWQLGLTYCVSPATETYERLAIYVPGPYLKPTDEDADLTGASSTDTFACELDAEATVGQFSCATAPIVMPVGTDDFAAQEAPAAYLYDGLEPYLSAGLVYVFAGCRGRSNGYDNTATGDGFFSGGAPWSVCDLKAAIRYLRYNRSRLPGTTDRIVPFGFAAGGLIAALVGVSGNAAGYDDYLDSIDAATHDGEGTTIGDEVAAVALWCPAPTPATADAAYEWELGQFAEADTRAEGTWTRIASNDLASAWGEQLSALCLRSGDEQLALEETDGGIYTDGSYYEHILSIITDSATNFLTDTEFPYAVDLTQASSANFPGSGEKAPEAIVATTSGAADSAEALVGAAGDVATQVSTSVTYASRSDYISALNEQERWVTYNETRGTARIAGLGALTRTLRAPTLPVCGFDTTSRSGAMNQLFGNDDQDSLHFSQIIANLLSERFETYEQTSNWDGALPGDWAGDLALTDALGSTMEERLRLYDPLTYLSEASDERGTSQVAASWRVNAGVVDAQTPLSASANLVLGLGSCEGVSVSYTAVWDAGHRLAEPGGADATQAFLGWVASLYPAEQEESS